MLEADLKVSHFPKPNSTFATEKDVQCVEHFNL